MTSSEHEKALKDWLNASAQERVAHLQMVLDNIFQLANAYTNSEDVTLLKAALLEIVEHTKFSQYGIKL